MTSKVFLLLAAMSTACTSAPVRSAPHSSSARVTFARGSVVAIGELHGTAESPRLADDFVTQALGRGLPVVLALEWPAGEQARVDSFLRSDGAPKARSELLEGPFWHRPYQDGRSSAAMFELLERMRVLQRGGADGLRVLCMDGAKSTGDDREQAMAERVIASTRSRPDAVHIALLGNLHARRTKGFDDEPGYEPVMFRIARAGLNVTTFAATYGAGTAWVCDGEAPSSCGPKPVGATDLADRNADAMSAAGGAFDGDLSVPAPTFSRPAAD